MSLVRLGYVALCWMVTATGSAGQTVPNYTVFSARASATSISVEKQPEPRITLQFKDTPIPEALHQVVAQAGLALIWSETKVPLKGMVSATLRNMTVDEALRTILRGTGTEANFSSDGQTIVIVRADPKAAGRDTTEGIIVGRVIDSASRQGVGGVSVKVVSTDISTTTSDSGVFVLRNVPSGDQLLVFRVFGYRSFERTVHVMENQRTAVRVTMTALPTVLSGMVTTATGKQRRVEIGNDIIVLNADSILQVAPVTNLTQLLAARVPGLTVQTTSGVPGAPSRLRLRGASSVTTSDDPIVIVDGIRVNADQSGYTTNTGKLTSGGGTSIQGSLGQVGTATYAGPSALDQIDPTSIETIEVLKGPSATATYGSDAANGVIIITTKRGHAGPTKWTFAAGTGWTKLPGGWPSYYHAFFRPFAGGDVYEGCRVGPNGSATAANCGSIKAAPIGDTLVALIPYQALNDPRVSPLSTGSDRNTTLTVRGGSGSLSYAVTGSGGKQIGYLRLPHFVAESFQRLHGGLTAPRWMTDPDAYTTYSETGNLTAQLGGAGATLSLVNSLFKSDQRQSSLQNTIGTLAFTYVNASQLSHLGTASTLAAQLFPDYYTRVQLKTTTFNDAISLTHWTPWHWLPPLNATAGISWMSNDNRLLTPRDYVLNTIDSLGQYSVGRGTSETRTLNIGTIFRTLQRVSTSIGLNVNSMAQTRYSAATVGLPIGVSVPLTLPYTNGSGPTQSEVHTATYGWYVAPTLNVNSRLFVNPGFRFDGGTASGDSRQLNLFPKIDVSYIAIDRPESQSALGLRLLRPRLAFGIAGIQPGPGQELRLLQSNAVILPGMNAPTSVLNVSSIGNTQLVPERSRELEGGLDADFGPNQRISVRLTAYNKTRYNAIISLDLPPSLALPTVINSTGLVGSYYTNVGTIRNTGVEASVSTQILDSRVIGWSVNANIASNHGLVTQLNSALPRILSGSSPTGYENRIVAGYPLNGYWARSIVNHKDVNGDGFISYDEIRLADSAVYYGSPEPRYEVTVGTNLSLLNDRLQLGTTLDYQNGMTQVLQTGNLAALGINDPTLTPAQQAAYAAEGGLRNRSAAGLIQTISTLRWNSLFVSYVIPSKMTHVLRVPFMSLSLQGSNLGLRSNYRGKDPNVNTFSTGNLSADTGQIPQPRTWLLRVSIGN